MFLLENEALPLNIMQIEIEHKRVSRLGCCSDCLEESNIDYILNPMINDHLEGTF